MSADGPETLNQASRHLQDHQLEHFDREYVSAEMWEQLDRCIRSTFPSGKFTFLDVGGGNGRFCDALLDRFPEASGVLLDNAGVLLGLNRPHPRKTLIEESAETFLKRSNAPAFDIVNLNWFLHHLVLGSYRMTRNLQRAALAAIPRLLTPGGRISVFENLYNGFISNQLPGWLIYQLTSSRVLGPLVRKLGANTAGCGVCFLGDATWETTFAAAGLRIEQQMAFGDWRISAARRWLLSLRSIRVGHFWLAANGTPASR